MGGDRLVYLGQPLSMVNQQFLYALVGVSFCGTVRRKCGADRKGADHAQAVKIIRQRVGDLMPDADVWGNVKQNVIAGKQ